MGNIETDIYQNVYQNYFLGNITQEWYEDLQKSWNWIPDTLSLTRQPIKTKIAFASGNEMLIIDANNNLDFSDDTPFRLIDFKNSMDPDSLVANAAIMVDYERLSENKIVGETIPLLVVRMKNMGNMLMNNFPQHAIAKFEGKEIAINSSSFTDPSYNRISLVLMNDSLNAGKKASRDMYIANNEFIEINGNIYKNKGVNQNKNVLVLEKEVLPSSQIYSTQVGFKALSFEGEDYLTKKTISLDSYKGKYVFLDFWAVWCGPCISDLPQLKAMYDGLDKSKVDIVSVLGDSKADALVKLVEKHQINWPQILSDDINKIVKNYGVHGYPTTFLIDPEGVIVAKNLRGKELEEKIAELTNKIE